MALAPAGLFVHINAPLFATFRGLDALTINNGGAGWGVASRLWPSGPHQHGIQPLPQPTARPVPEVAIHRGPGRILAGQHAPLTTRTSDIENGIEDQPWLPLAGSPTLCRWWKKFHQALPFYSRQIGRIHLREGHHPSTLPNLFSKHSL